MTPTGGPSAAVHRTARPSWASAVGAATGAVLARPAAWPVALAGLLVRGALVPFTLPIVVLPTVTGLTTALSWVVIAIALGQPDAGVAWFVVAVAVVATAWLLTNVVLGALTDAFLIAWIADELQDAAEPRPVRAIDVVRIAVARAVAHLPLLLVAAWGAARLVEVTRHELIMPGDLAVPIVLRVIAGAPEVVALLLVAWLSGEVVGELAAREVMLAGASATSGLGRAVRRTLRHLPAVLATFALGTIGVLALAVPPVAAAAVAWAGVRSVLLGGGAVAPAILAALLLSLAWLGGLALAALGATWRSALWTAEAIRQAVIPPASASRG